MHHIEVKKGFSRRFSGRPKPWRKCAGDPICGVCLRDKSAFATMQECVDKASAPAAILKCLEEKQ